MLKYQFNFTRDHYLGNPLAPIELVEYGDFLCEYSGEVYTEIKKLQQVLGNQLKFVFRHYPLTSIHPLSLEAAMAAEAASLQDSSKFWSMHDLIFENQKYLSRSSLSRFAEEVGMDAAPLENSRLHKQLLQKVLSDFESGVNSGVDGTPTFFINGHRYTGFNDFESLYKTCKYVLTFKSAA